MVGLLVFFAMTVGDNEEMLTKVFKIFDVNSDGVISKDEVITLISALFGFGPAIDPEFSLEHSMGEKAFEAMDKDGSGKVTMSEFVTACQKDEGMCKMFAARAMLFLDHGS